MALSEQSSREYSFKLQRFMVSLEAAGAVPEMIHYLVGAF
jgi:hypothetical protein